MTEPAQTGCGGTVPEPGEQLTCTLAGLCLCVSEAHRLQHALRAQLMLRIPGRKSTYCIIASQGSGLLNSWNTLKKQKVLTVVSLFPLTPMAVFHFLVSTLGKYFPSIKRLLWLEQKSKAAPSKIFSVCILTKALWTQRHRSLLSASHHSCTLHRKTF